MVNSSSIDLRDTIYYNFENNYHDRHYLSSHLIIAAINE